MGKINYNFTRSNVEIINGSSTLIDADDTNLIINDGIVLLNAILNDIPVLCTSIDARFELDTDWDSVKQLGFVVMCDFDMLQGYYIVWNDYLVNSIEIYRRDSIETEYTTNTLLTRSPISVPTVDNQWRIKVAPIGDEVSIQVFTKTADGWLCICNTIDSANTAGRAGVSILNNDEAGLISNLVIRYEARVEITSPQSYQVFQRVGGVSNIPITGTYLDEWDDYYARWNNGDWVKLTDNGNNSFSGILPNQPEGQGTLYIRDSLGFTVQTAEYIGVGDVFIVIGQSNAAGEFTSFQSSINYPERASMYSYYGDKWNNFVDPSGANVEKGSVWLKVADHIMGSENIPVGFICTAVGGTSLVASPTYWSPGDAGYEDAVQKVSDSNINDAKAVLWYQGETDAFRGGVSAATYAAALDDFITNFQSDTGLLTIPFVVALIGEVFTTAAANVDAIRDGIIYAWNTNANVLAGPVAHDREMSDGVHWTSSADAIELAARWWRCLKSHFYSGTDSARSKIINTASRTTTTISLTFTGGTGALQNATDITGWSHSTASIVSAVATGTDTMDVVISSNIAGRLSWLSGNRTVTATLKDTGTIASVPPDPFFVDV